MEEKYITNGQNLKNNNEEILKTEISEKLKQERKIEKIIRSYEAKEDSDLDKLNKLDKKVKQPAKIFGYTFGTIGTLILGFGMSITLGAIINIFGLGIAIGIVGLFAVSITYPIYKHILKKRKAKYSNEILSLSEKLLNS